MLEGSGRCLGLVFVGSLRVLGSRRALGFGFRV